jgi:hypothetical protein
MDNKGSERASFEDCSSTPYSTSILYISHQSNITCNHVFFVAILQLRSRKQEIRSYSQIEFSPHPIIGAKLQRDKICIIGFSYFSKGAILGFSRM